MDGVIEATRNTHKYFIKNLGTMKKKKRWFDGGMGDKAKEKILFSRG